MNQIDILLVEDNPADLKMTLHALRGGKITDGIQVARDGEKALEFIFCEGAFAARTMNDGPRVILFDLKLPKVDGLEVLARVKGETRRDARNATGGSIPPVPKDGGHRPVGWRYRPRFQQHSRRNYDAIRLGRDGRESAPGKRRMGCWESEPPPKARPT